MRLISVTATPNALTTQELESATEHDHTLQAVSEIVRSSSWHHVDVYKGQDQVDYPALLAFRSVKDELTISDRLLFRDHRIVIPKALQSRAIKLGHEGHQGISKTKSLMRTKVWFPDMDKKIEDAIKSCIPCQANSNVCAREPLRMSPLPRGPWLNLSLDFCGPLPSGDYLLVLIDEYSRYPVVKIVRSTSAEATIAALDDVFAVFSYPEVIKTDNGPPFQSRAWMDFMAEIGVVHRRITPRWPQANAQAEGFNKPLMKAVRAAVIEGRNWRREVQVFLRMYRCTPHTTTLFTPFRLMFSRDPKTKLPETTSDVIPKDDMAVRARDLQCKTQRKEAADRRNHAKPQEMSVGDHVLVKRDSRPGKLETPFRPEPWVVHDRKGPMVTVARGSRTQTRNVSQFRKITPQPPQCIAGEAEEEDFRESEPQEPLPKPTPRMDTQRMAPPTPRMETPRMAPLTPRMAPRTLRMDTPVAAPTPRVSAAPARPRRELRPPAHFKDYEMQ